MPCLIEINGWFLKEMDEKVKDNLVLSIIELVGHIK
jgi:hypothetical protein